MAWYKTLRDWLCSKDMGFQVGKNDPCIFHNPKTGLRLAVVVDDCIVRGSMEESEAFYKAMADRFKVKDPTYLTVDTPIKYVGFDITLTKQDDGHYVTIDQGNDLNNYLNDIGVPNCKNVTNPMPHKNEMYSDPAPLDEEEGHRYRSIMGALNYYACASRYDISYPVSKLSQFSAHPTKGASRALSRVLSYLRCNTDFGITGRMHNGVDDIQCFSDSDMAGDLRFDTHSQTGIMIMLNDAPVYWRSVK